MPKLCIFIDEYDKHILLRWLNAQEEIAFIVSTSLEEWKAVRTVDDLQDGKYLLWHTQCGPLPRFVVTHEPMLIQEEERDEHVLRQTHSTRQIGFIADPWNGWRQVRATGTDRRVPFFGGAPGIIGFTLETRRVLHSELSDAGGVIIERSVCDENTLGLSGFGWMGYPYRTPLEQELDWWKKLHHWVATEAILLTQVPEEWADGQLREAWDFYAFPSACQALKSGMNYYADGFDLSEYLR